MTNIETLIQSFNTKLEKLTPVEWGELNRHLTKDVSRFSGRLSYRMTPYIIKIINSFMESNPAQIIVLMKGSQLGFTVAGIATVLGWIIAQNPANTLFITENEEKVKDQMQGVFNQMINSSGLDKVVGNHNIRDRQAKGRRSAGTGDTLKGLTFPNGKLYTLSGQTIGSLSSWSIKYGIYDEIERWKGVYKNAGDFMELIEPRHRSYGNTRKILLGSTPEIEQTSNINPLYLMGDQQKYMVPCKNCGEMIDLQWIVDLDDKNDKAGIYYERHKSGKYIENSAKYICQKCGNMFDETHKYDMYEETYHAFKNNSSLVCDWHPTAEPEMDFHESYHISTMYSPAGFYTWNDMCRKWASIFPKGGVTKTAKLQAFYNQELGLPWKEKSKEIKVNQLLKNTRNYDINTVPNALSIADGNGKIVLLTCAIDLNGKEDDARLDYEVLAWSKSGSSYSIDHGSIGTFERSKSMRYSALQKEQESEESRIKWTYRLNQANNVWTEFEKIIMSRVYNRDDGTAKPKVSLYGIDAGHFTIHAMAFVNKHPNCIALKGKSDNKFTKFDQIKSFYTKSEKVPDLYLVEGDIVKDHLSELITLVWSEDMGIDQQEGFMNFPKPEHDKYTYKSYFHEYEGEKRELDINDMATAVGSKWTKKHNSSPNHFWDVRVYNHVVREILVEKICKAAKVPVNWTNFSNLFK